MDHDMWIKHKTAYPYVVCVFD